MRAIYRFEAMTTPCELVLFEESKTKSDDMAKLVLKEAKRLEKKYNFFSPASYLSQINKREIDSLDEETLWLIKTALKYHKETNGVFDITFGAVKELYKKVCSIEDFNREKENYFKFAGCENIKLSKKRIIFKNPYVKIDFGGMIKEYAVDRVAKILRRKKIKSALINFGGDIYALGSRPDGRPFKIGIKDPKNPSRFAKFVEIENQALTTSASYERNYKIEDRVFSHIIAKSDSEHRPLSVSVISNSCLDSGIYSTSLMIDPTIKVREKVVIFL